MSAMQEYCRQAALRDAREREDVIRWLLGRWVSGLSPAIAEDEHGIIGLCDADASIGDKPDILRIWDA